MLSPITLERIASMAQVTIKSAERPITQSALAVTTLSQQASQLEETTSSGPHTE